MNEGRKFFNSATKKILSLLVLEQAMVKQFVTLSLKSGGVIMCHYHSNETSARCLKEMCHEIYQNSNSSIRHQNERNIKIPAQNI